MIEKYAFNRIFRDFRNKSDISGRIKDNESVTFKYKASEFTKGKQNHSIPLFDFCFFVFLKFFCLS